MPAKTDWRLQSAASISRGNWNNRGLATAPGGMGYGPPATTFGTIQTDSPTLLSPIPPANSDHDYYGRFVPALRQAWITGWSEPPNQSANISMAGIQTALRQAEGGDMRQLFAIYRDMVASDGTIETEWGKRKMGVVGQPHVLFPASKDADDLLACEAIRRMISDCENWQDAMISVLDASLYPLSVAEKIYQQAAPARPGEPALQFTLKRLCPVNYFLLCMKLPYLSPTFVIPNQTLPPADRSANVRSFPDSLTYYPDAWEPDLRLFTTFQNGFIDNSWFHIYALDPMRHLVHRGHFMTSHRDNYGGPMRGLMFWWLLSCFGRDWWTRGMERYGSPFPVAKADMQQKDTLNFLRDAFSQATKIGALVVDKRAEVEIRDTNYSGMSDSYAKYLEFCNRAKSTCILGQTLSTGTANTGLGSGVSDLHASVMNNYFRFDQVMLGETLRRQLFDPFLMINGLRGRPPKIAWGGESESDQVLTAKVLESFARANLEPDDESLRVLSARVGFNLKRMAIQMGALSAKPHGGNGK